MIKHLTVGMPLAVPTQKRPPSKYASHPYPIYLEDSVAMAASMTGTGSTQAVNRDLLLYAAQIRGAGELRNVLRQLDIGFDNLGYPSAIMHGNGELKSIIKPIILVSIARDNTHLSTSINGVGVLKNIVIRHDLGRNTIKYSVSMNGSGEMA